MDQKLSGTDVDLACSKGPGDEGQGRGCAKWEERARVGGGGQCGANAGRPAINRVGQSVLCLGAILEDGPEVRSRRTQQYQGLILIRETVILGQGEAADRVQPGLRDGARQGLWDRRGGQLDRMSEPAPWSVNSSSRQALGARPSRMTAARQPPFKAETAVSVLGIMPP